jgi:AcrR family transcriptional regulator
MAMRTGSRRRADGDDKPRERRRRAAPGFNEKRILDVAIGEFSRKGLAGARVDEIARRAGVNKQLLYYYFKSKEGLFNAVLSEMASISETAIEDMRKIAEVDGYPKALINHATLKKRKQWQLWRRLWAWEALERSDTAIVREQERRAAWERCVDLIRDAQARGEIDSRFDPAMLMLAIEGVLNYPHVLPQNTKCVTGSAPMSEEFIGRQQVFLGQFFEFLRPKSPAGAKAGKSK